jgi:antitoxin HigA-1
MINGDKRAMSNKRRTPAGWAIHPGEILKEEFLRPLEISGYALAKSIKVPAQTVNDIVLRKRGVSAEMAVRLSKFFGTTPEFWMNLQAAYELANVRNNKKLSQQVEKINPHRAA